MLKKQPCLRLSKVRLCCDLLMRAELVSGCNNRRKEERIGGDFPHTHTHTPVGVCVCVFLSLFVCVSHVFVCLTMRIQCSVLQRMLDEVLVNLNAKSNIVTPLWTK